MSLEVYKTMAKTVTIPAASVAILRGTPYTLVPAPGANLMNVFKSAEVVLDYTAPAFTESSDNLAIKYNNGSGLAVSDTIEMTAFITLTADSRTNAVAVKDQIVAKATAANKALVLHNTGDGEFGGSGGSALIVTIIYEIHSVPA